MPKKNSKGKNKGIKKIENQVKQLLNMKKKNKNNRKKNKNQNNRVIQAVAPIVAQQQLMGQSATFGFQLSPPAERFLSCLTHPFSCVNGAKVPDDFLGNTVEMNDFFTQQVYDLYGATTALGGDPDTQDPFCSAFAYWIVPGISESDTYYNADNSNISGSTNCVYYRIACAPINSNGQIVSNDDNLDTYNCIPTINIQTMFNTITPQQGLCSGGRVVSAALRLIPIVENVTDTSVNGVSQFLVAEMPFSTFNEEFLGFDADVKNIFTGLEGSSNFHTYNNAAGVTVRFNALQQPYYNFKTIDSWGNDNNFVDHMIIPVIVVRTMQPQDGARVSGNTSSSLFADLPFYVECIWWLENSVNIPTPITCLPSPIDASFEEIRKVVLSGGHGIFPTIAAGHSFKDLSENIGKFFEHASSIFSRASHISSNAHKHYSNFLSSVQ